MHLHPLVSRDIARKFAELWETEAFQDSLRELLLRKMTCIGEAGSKRVLIPNVPVTIRESGDPRGPDVYPLTTFLILPPFVFEEVGTLTSGESHVRLECEKLDYMIWGSRVHEVAADLRQVIQAQFPDTPPTVDIYVRGVVEKEVVCVPVR